MQESLVWFLGQEFPWRGDRLLTPVFLGFLGGSVSKEFACNAGDLDSIPELGRSPGEGNCYPLQYSGLENSMDRGAWDAKNQTWLSNLTTQHQATHRISHHVSVVQHSKNVYLSLFFSFFSFIFISWRLITLQYCSGFCHTLTWICLGFTCSPHPDPPSHLPL